MDALLKRDANEKLKTVEGESVSDFVGKKHHNLNGERQAKEQRQLVRTLLARAPAERAWRRRGLFLMCCSRRGRAKGGMSASNQAQDLGLVVSRSDAAAMPCGDGNNRKLAKVNADCVGGTVGGQREGSGGYGGGGMADDLAALDERRAAAGNWHEVVARVLHLQEEGLFRAIVCFL